MSELKPCPFCGGKAVFDTVSPGAGNPRGLVRCENLCCEMCWISSKYEAIEAWNRRAETVKVETNIYDKEEIFPDCTVQVLTNTATGETSVGWWKNG